MRQEFPRTVRVAIISRATIARVHYCGQCGQPAKKFEVDHIVAEAFRVGQRKRLTALDGRLLCVPCHRKKTDRDAFLIAQAKAREALDLGDKDPRKRKIPTRAKPPREEKRPAVAGRSNLARRYIDE